MLVLGMGGTIDKDYPRTTKGYAFEIDEPAARRVCETANIRGLLVRSIVRKDSQEITDADRDVLVEAVRGATETRIVVTHGTDTLAQTARYVAASGAAHGKAVAFTGAMKPERFKDSDAAFNVGAAVTVTSVLERGAVVVVMGGRAIPASRCQRDLRTGEFVDVLDVEQLDQQRAGGRKRKQR